MRVVELWRHPVKSMQGESLAQAVLEDSGLQGDRRWGIVDRATGNVLTAKREPALLLASARLADDDVEISLPDGIELRGLGTKTDDALSSWLGRAVELVHAPSRDGGVSEFYENPIDETSNTISWTMPPGRFVDAMPLLVVTTASLRAGRSLHPGGAWDTRRFRPNIVVDVDGDGWVEDGWCGHTLRIGDTRVQPVIPCERCTMVTRAQPGLERDLDVFKALARDHAKNFGVWSAVQAAGTINVGDDVIVE